MKETKDFFKATGLEKNKRKCAKNIEACAEDTALLSGTQCYKYLGIAENE